MRLQRVLDGHVLRLRVLALGHVVALALRFVLHGQPHVAVDDDLAAARRAQRLVHDTRQLFVVRLMPLREVTRLMECSASSKSAQ